MNTFDKFLNDVLYPLLSFLALLVFLCNAPKARAGDFDIYLAPEAMHMSHLTQHSPFTSSPTSYGANMLGLALGMDWRHLNVELVESYNFSHHWSSINSNGEICGPREQFSLRIRYKFVIIGSN